MTIDELAELTQRGFDGLNERLDALNGRTRKNEVAVGELRVSTRTLENTSFDREERLRVVEQRTAVSDALLKRESRKQGLKWGSIASAAMVALIYGIAHHFGISLPQ